MRPRPTSRAAGTDPSSARGAVLIALASLGAGSCATPVDGDEPVVPSDLRSGLAVAIENDVFIAGDDNYTNGLAISWLTGPLGAAEPDSLRRRLGEAWPRLPFLGKDRHALFLAVGLGQEIFTPDDIEVADPPADDQPYAGILYLDFGLARLTASRSDTWQLRLGVVGPSSLAGRTQIEYHEAIGADEPLGWDSQLPDEPIFNVDYTVAYEWLNGIDGDGDGARLVPVGSVGLGTYFTGAAAGLFASAGWNVPDPVGAISLRRGVGPVLLGDVAADGRTSLHFFGGGGAFLVGHYLPLDGTVFRSSPSVDSEPLVGFGTLGATIRYGPASLTLLATLMTETFETQRDNEQFGSLTFSFRL